MMSSQSAFCANGLIIHMISHEHFAKNHVGESFDLTSIHLQNHAMWYMSDHCFAMLFSGQTLVQAIPCKMAHCHMLDNIPDF